MNSNCLTKLYDKLTPTERLPLILAASARGDMVDRERLARSAPVETYQVPHHFWLAEGLKKSALYHGITMFHLSALFWKIGSIVDQPMSLGEDQTEGDIDQFVQKVRCAAYLLLCHAEGWRIFCTSMKVDPDQPLRWIPFYRTVIAAEQAARLLAFSEEEAAAQLMQKGREVAGLVTAEKVAAELKDLMQEMTEYRL